MRVVEKNRQEIESRLKSMGDYVRIQYLRDCLKAVSDFETKKFVLIKLAGLYETRGMFDEAGRMYRNMAEINTTFQGKINDFVKSGELLIRSGKFEEADISFKRALGIADTIQNFEIKRAVKEFYKTQARFYLTRDKRKHALDTYEKMLTLDLSLEEKREVKEKLMELYLKLGRTRDYSILKRSV